MISNELRHNISGLSNTRPTQHSFFPAKALFYYYNGSNELILVLKQAKQFRISKKNKRSSTNYAALVITFLFIVALGSLKVEQPCIK